MQAEAFFAYVLTLAHWHACMHAPSTKYPPYCKDSPGIVRAAISDKLCAAWGRESARAGAAVVAITNDEARASCEAFSCGHGELASSAHALAEPIAVHSSRIGALAGTHPLRSLRHSSTAMHGAAPGQHRGWAALANEGHNTARATHEALLPPVHDRRAH